MSKYLPKSLRGYTVSVAVQDEKAAKICAELDHFWKPLPEIAIHHSQWKWACANCGYTIEKAPAVAVPFISKKELELMVDSSLRVADQVVEDNQTVQGELWIMRSALWMYWPYKIHCIYHILQGNPFIMLFRYVSDGRDWKPLNDTDSYRQLLLKADKMRLEHNRGIPLIVVP